MGSAQLDYVRLAGGSDWTPSTASGRARRPVRRVAMPWRKRRAQRDATIDVESVLRPYHVSV
jgi:hypothetical protein